MISKHTNKRILSSIRIIAVLAIAMGSLSVPVLAQQDAPVREFTVTDPDQFIAFDKNNTFTEAVAIFNALAQEHKERFIIDRSNYTGPVGLDLPSMYWEDALKFILDYNGLELVINETYYEIKVPEIQEGPTTAAGGATGTNPNATSNLASLETREIRINATFFEGNKRALQEIGVDWSTLTSDVPLGIADFVTEQGAEQLPTDNFTTDQFVNVNTFGAQNVSQNVFNAVINSGEIGNSQISVQALFSAFEADNLGEILATPYTSVIDGEEGIIQVGQDFSIKQRDFAGNVTDVFFQTGTILTVTPTVIVEDSIEFIYLQIQAERSSAAPDPVSTIVNKTVATTKALLVNGETAVLAGLFRKEEQTVRRGIPLLKDIPLLGYLFGYNSRDIIENELVILIQAEFVKTIPERLEIQKTNPLSKQEILDNARLRHRTDMDIVPPTVDDLLPAVAEATEDSSEAAADSTVASNDPMTEMPTDSSEVETVETEDPETEVLTPEQEQLAKELSLPVENPELMVVIPSAFDLEKYLDYKEQGIEVPVQDPNEKYFVIGGSFIVRKNAYAFEQRLKDMGYTTRMLFNTRSRFHFVAYDGYRNFDQAVNELQRLRQDANQDAWLFIYENGETELRTAQ